MTTTDFHKDEELSEEEKATCDSGTALSVKINRLIDEEGTLAMTVELRSHIHSNREARAVLAALDSARDHLADDIVRNSLPEKISDLLEQLFEQIFEEPKTKKGKKAKSTEDVNLPADEGKGDE